MLNNASKIFIAGRNGLVGSAMERAFRNQGYTNIIGEPSKVLDLRCEAATRDYFDRERPDYVVLAAAKVGGIWANTQAPADFLLDNLRIQNNVISNAQRCGVKKLVFLASSCIYPRMAPQPMHEEDLLTGALEPTNEGYALAKIAGLKLCEYMNQQYGTDFISVMPCNLYGLKDNFHPTRSHFVPGLIRRFHHAKISGQPFVEVWGTGTPRRELMCSDDLADAVLFLLEQDFSSNQFLNVGTGVDHTVRQVAEKIKDVVGYPGELVFDTSKPDGMPQKLMDISKIRAMGWQPKISLEDGLSMTYRYYVDEIYPNEGG